MIETLPSTALAGRLRQRIERDGPITFHDWMHAALYDPDGGYYCRSDKARWGREGDYRTSPECSSLFVSSFARYFAGLHKDLNQPHQWTILEVGSGDGHFAEGVLNTLKDFFPDTFSATRYVIDEVSLDSRLRAQARLKPFTDQVEFRSLADTEVETGIIFSNELLDAFPVHRVMMKQGQLREMYVGVSSEGNFEWVTGRPSSASLVSYSKSLELKEQQMAEVNFAAEDWIKTAARQLQSGYLITVDYGRPSDSLSSADTRETLRGFQRHQLVADVLEAPGEIDLTTTINWTQIRSTGRTMGLEEVAFQRLDKFLLDAGILAQLEAESDAIHDEVERARLSASAREMILPEGMASYFQVLVQKKN